MKKTFVVAALLVPALLLTACNTTRGVGRDVKSVGDAVEKAAN